MGREIGERIDAALRALPERQRAVFVLRHYEELSLEEIAETLDMSLGTVKSACTARCAACASGCRECARDPPARPLAAADCASSPLGALDEAERAAARAPRRGLRGLRGASSRSRVPRSRSWPRTPSHGAEPPVPLGALVTRVQARLDEAPARRTRLAAPSWPAPASRPRSRWRRSRCARRGRSCPRPRPRKSHPPARRRRTPAPSRTPTEALRRMESTLARERAARYLTDAQDVLVTVASAPQRCARRRNAVDVGPEARAQPRAAGPRRLFVELDAPAGRRARRPRRRGGDAARGGGARSLRAARRTWRPSAARSRGAISS